MDPMALLEQNRIAIKKKIISICPEARELLKQLEQTEELMATSVMPTGKYAGHPRARDAIRELFREKGYPLSEQEVKDEIVDRGGWIQGRGDLQAKKKSSRMMVKKSLKGHLPDHDGYRNLKLKFKNGLWGLEEWPDKLFERK